MGGSGARAMAAATALATAVTVAGCTSSGRSQSPPASDSAVPSPPASAAASTPSTSASATSPSPTPTRALSPFEQDPAVKAIRAWAAQAGRTVNKGRYDDAALNALMTNYFRKGMKAVLGGEVRFRYPGPIPFTPTSVKVTDSSNRDVHICVVASGFSLNRKTGRPAQKHTVLPFDSGAAEVNGKWLVSQFRSAKFSCTGVRIQEVKF